MNAVRHGHARRVEMDIAFDDEVLRLRVSDDGGGFNDHDSEPSAATAHYGLLSMKERAIEAGATLEKALSSLDDEDQIEVALGPNVAAGQRAEQDRPPHAESRQSQNNPLELRVELAPPPPRRLPIHYAQGLWSDHG